MRETIAVVLLAAAVFLSGVWLAEKNRAAEYHDLQWTAGDRSLSYQFWLRNLRDKPVRLGIEMEAASLSFVGSNSRVRSLARRRSEVSLEANEERRIAGSIDFPMGLRWRVHLTPYFWLMAPEEPPLDPVGR